MAQLRDAQTSEVIAEGTPLEVVTIARELGLSAGVVGPGETAEHLDLIYDDVGLGFNPDAVVQASDENIAGLKAASSANATKDKDIREAMKRAHADAVETVAAARERAPDAQAELDAARERVG